MKRRLLNLLTALSLLLCVAVVLLWLRIGVWWVNNEANFHDQLASRGRHANGVVTEVVSERRHRRFTWDYALKYR